MSSTRGRLLVLGVDSFTGVRYTGFTDGDCPWDLSLGKRTGDGKFDGETFWVGCGWFFGGGRGRPRGTPRHVLLRCFHSSKQPFLCYILYVEQWGFRCSMRQTIAKVSPVLDALGRHVRCSGFDNLTTSSTH
jgi:hypothetical protein